MIFSGERALLTGGSCCMALALARGLMDQGVLPILSHRNAAGREKIETGLADYPGRFETVFMDLAAPESFEPAIAKARPDYLVDFAQSDLEGFVAAADSNRVWTYVAENISARSQLVKHAAREMLKKRFGRLIFVSSTAAAMPNRGQGFYAAAKRAAEGFYRNLGLEMGERGITALSLRPGYVDAGRGSRYLEGKEIPEHWVLSPQDVAQTLLFLLSDPARGFNATELTMDGGLTAGK